MKLTLVALILTLTWSANFCQEEEEEENELATLRAELDSAIESIAELRTIVARLGRQTMLQQFNLEERTRINVNSGIKVIRSRKRGFKNYESPTHVGFSLYAIHDHSNYIRTIGMGEVAVVMNGVEFRTRHNDYKLVKPSTTSTEYHATEPISFPGVPPSVTGTVDEQIDEMILWFKAFKEQDISIRNYTEYFKPVLCYLEGAWTTDTDLTEPFKSERHKIDADSWFDLQEKIRFASETGTKNSLENLAHLPTAIKSVNETSAELDLAQWNYRILCQPLERDIPLANLKYVDDLSYRMRDDKSVEKTLETRAARFKLYDDNMSSDYNLLDELFYTVPGMDNIPDPNMRQINFGEGDLYRVGSGKTPEILKNGYYHRQYKYAKAGAMGLSVNPRGFNDENAWMAQTTQARIAPIGLEKCQRELQPNGRKPKICRTYENKFTYAIPIEIVYLTPLLSWNPYNIPIHQDHKTAVSKGGTGGAEKPFFGADWNRYYLTPAAMFSKKNELGSADTVRAHANILDSEDNVRQTVASGTRIWTDEIEDVGRVRLRYPIAPVSDEGTSVWKELTAFEDLYFATTKHINKPEQPVPPEILFKMSTTTQDPPGEHTHEIYVDFSQYRDKLMKGKVVEVTSEQGQGHTHILKMKFDRDIQRFYYVRCDSMRVCFDGHDETIEIETDNEFTRELMMTS